MNRYFLGCPMWANKSWVGTLFPTATKPGAFLRHYAQVFNSVEGNTTFYAVPSRETIAKWVKATPSTFRFAFKFPRTISHDMGLRACEAERDTFLQTLVPLGPRVGPIFLQLPPTFDDFSGLERFLALLPREFAYAVEARHPCFTGALEEAFVQLLQELEMDRVIFDTRLLMAFESEDPEIRGAQRRKPKSPVRTHATGPHPFLRFAGHPEPSENRDLLAFWADITAGWLQQGRTPYIFMHQVPEDEKAPQQARLFHQLLLERVAGLAPMRPWPGEEEPPEPEQLSLF